MTTAVDTSPLVEAGWLQIIPGHWRWKDPLTGELMHEIRALATQAERSAADAVTPEPAVAKCPHCGQILPEAK